jgi:hypothetical protein
LPSLNDIVTGRAMVFIFVVMACSAVLVVVSGLGARMERGGRRIGEEVLAKKKLE